MNRENLLLSEGWILTMTADKAADASPFRGWVGVEENRIALVTEDAAEAEAFRRRHAGALREVDCRNRVIMPGLINTHCHVAMTLQRNYADDIPLMEWLHDHIWPFEAIQTPDEVALGAELGIVEMLLGGVTSFVDMYWDEHKIAPVAERLGIRALLCPSFIDHAMEKNEADLEALLPQMSERVRAGIGPHAPYTVSRENLLHCKALAEKYDLPMTIHVAETEAEMASVREATGMTPVEWLESLGLLNERLIAAHCVYTSPADRVIMRERRVKIAHNPSSNMKIASGIAPLEAYQTERMPSTIGTDGPCSNNDLDMWEEMRNCSFLAKVASKDPLVLPAYEVLKMATRYGAAAIGHADELGVVRQGALADLIVIDLMKPHLQPVNNLISDLVYCCKASDVETVIVDGRIVVDGRTIAGVKLEELYHAATQAVERVKRTMRK